MSQTEEFLAAIEKLKYKLTLDYYLRGASSISDIEFLEVVDRLRKEREKEVGRPNPWVYHYEVAECFFIHPHRIRSKMRRMMNRNLINGCNCGCRGEIWILPAGEELLRSRKKQGV